MATKVQFLTTTGSTLAFPRPADWNDADNKIECIGAAAGGGGAYAAILNTAIATTSTYRVGDGASSDGGTGGDTWFGGETLGAATVGAKGAAVNIGGQASASIGDTKFSGGNSGGDAVGTGGGGAAGPNGAGANGAGSPTRKGGGGGGANGGGTGNTNSTGGTNRNGTGAGAASNAPIPLDGGNGSDGGGGGGGDTSVDGKSLGDTGNGGDGSSDLIWTRTETSPGQTAGPGSGAGGSGTDDGATVTGDAGTGGDGGLYGGGGGRSQTATDGVGKQGIIVLTWTPSAGFKSSIPAIIG